MTPTDGGWYVMGTFFVASFFETWLWTCGMAEKEERQQRMQYGLKESNEGCKRCELESFCYESRRSWAVIIAPAGCYVATVAVAVVIVARM